MDNEVTKMLLEFVLNHMREHEATVLTKLNLILSNQEAIMAQQAHFEEVLSKINVATNEMSESSKKSSTALTAIVAMLAALRDQVTNAGLPQDVEDRLLEGFQQASDAITAEAKVSAEVAAQAALIASNPSDPVPASLRSRKG